MTDNQLIERWNQKVPVKQIAAEFGVTVNVVHGRARRLGLESHFVKKSPENGGPEPGDPREEEIEELAAEIRRGWSDEERVRRIADKTRVRVPYSMPCYESVELFGQHEAISYTRI